MNSLFRFYKRSYRTHLSFESSFSSESSLRMVPKSDAKPTARASAKPIRVNTGEVRNLLSRYFPLIVKITRAKANSIPHELHAIAPLKFFIIHRSIGGGGKSALFLRALIPKVAKHPVLRLFLFAAFGGGGNRTHVRTTVSSGFYARSPCINFAKRWPMDRLPFPLVRVFSSLPIPGT